MAPHASAAVLLDATSSSASTELASSFCFEPTSDMAVQLNQF